MLEYKSKKNPNLKNILLALLGVATLHTPKVAASKSNHDTELAISSKKNTHPSTPDTLRKNFLLTEEESNFVVEIIRGFERGNLPYQTQRQILGEMYNYLNPNEIGPTTPWNNFSEEVFPFLDPQIKNKGVEYVKKGKW